MKEDFLKYIRENYELFESRKVEQAYKLAVYANEGEKRLSGEDWINHCVGVAYILAKMHMDVDTICGGLLHDVTRTSKVSVKDVEREIGEDVAELVKGLEKINEIKYRKDTVDESESLRRLIVTMGKDIRVILIKLADRLHNMRTIEYMTKEKQLKYASETRDVFSGLAERLGLSRMQGELDDLCFKTLNPDEYSILEAELNKKYDKWQETMQKIAGVLEYVLREQEIKGKVTYRFKNFYSLYKKFQKRGTEKIYDIIAFRILVDNVDDCYKVLGAIHQKYRPVPGRIKDYIADPKPNGYQSLHTTLITSDGTPFEVQIRTYEMHDYCEYGIAAHWNYKGASDKAYMLQGKLDWVKNLIESEMQITDSKNFVKAIQMDFSSAEIWVFTPKYKPISLPEGSTPIDFAYAIHTELGHKCVAAKINGKKVSLGTKLETGDVVEIIKSSDSKGPSRDWINVAVSQNARYNIRLFFRKETTPENIVFGKKILEEETKKVGLTIGDIIDENNFKILKEKFNFESTDDMFASIGYKGVTVNQIIKPIQTKIQNQKEDAELAENCPILVEGNTVTNYKLSHCCNPVPGDNIVATTNKDGLYSIHTIECKNIKLIGEDRYFKANWNNKIKKLYDVNLHITGKDEEGMLSKMLTNIYKTKMPFLGITAQNFGEKFEVTLHIKVANKTELDKFIKLVSVDAPYIETISRKNIG